MRVAVVGFNGRGRAHISAYLKMPNVEIAALCDVDQAVVDRGCKTIEAAGKKRPATYADFRKLLREPDTARRLEELGIEPVGNSPEEFAAFIKSEIERWTRVAKAANVKME